MTYPNGGDLLVQVLREAGVDTVFGVISVHNLPLVEAVAEHLRFVPVRHEASAVNAADGYARARGGLGCALTSTGTGAGNAAGALIESLATGSSVLHVTGQVELAYLGSGRGFIHETQDQLGMLRAVSKQAYSICSTGNAGMILRQAVREALAAPGGPISVEWPIDLQYAKHASQPEATTSTTAEQVPDEADVLALVGLLHRAERPLIWAGGGVTRAGVELQVLLEALGAGLITSNSGRGAVPEDHRLCIGNYGTSPVVQTLLDDSDLVLSLGTHFRSNETGDYTLRLPGSHVQVDLDPAAPGRVYPVRLGITAEIRALLSAVLSRLETPARPQGSWAERIEDTRRAVRSRQREALGEHAVFADALRAALPRSAVVARDVTIASSSWGNRLLEIYDPTDNVFPRGGGIGQGLGMGLGAAIGRPDGPTVVIAGDGGLAVHFGELLTLAQERPHLVLMVFNDGGYGVLRNMQDGAGRRHAGVDLTTPQFETLARSLDLPYRRIGDSSEVRSTLEKAVADGGPVVVEIDLGSYGEMPTPFTPPVRVPQPEPQTDNQSENQTDGEVRGND